ncbi:hypothetical protein M427DRAFT_502283 [Gonapodya prolifera JEL478]|uniref:Reelin domain-containing protein n=1 Tax=Gonapodya prolifera (strain JEL478) TaxID=1344416 RepID=A0A139A6Z7_GONPJ|nr:hypothetical protein M427DRAFT_502283 [Gonapodya prolifera JEL478]|eukprot:KXS12484.1 hypothetical protein M427DRAFT_502283 [Gonapodya prolifera JEL478]
MRHSPTPTPTASRSPLVRTALAALVASLALSLFASHSSAMPTNGVTVCQYPDTAVQAMTHGPPASPKATLSTIVNADGTVTLALAGVAQYKGIVMYVRDAANTTHMGTIALPSADFQTKDCTAAVGSTSGAAGTIQHNSNVLKTVMSFTWTPDAAVVGGQALVAEAVVVESFMNWYIVAPASFAASAAAGKQAAGAAMTTAAGAIAKSATTAAGAKPTTAAGAKSTTAAGLKSMTASMAKPTLATMAAMMTRTTSKGLTPTIILTAPTQTCMCYVVQQPASEFELSTLPSLQHVSLHGIATLLVTMVTRTATLGMTKPTTAAGAKVTAMSTAAAMKMATTAAGMNAATTAAGVKAMTTAAGGAARPTTAAAVKAATTAAAAMMGSGMNNLQKRYSGEMSGKPAQQAAPVAPANMAMEAQAATTAGVAGAKPAAAATTAAGAVMPPAMSTPVVPPKPAVTPPAMPAMTMKASGVMPPKPPMTPPTKPVPPTMPTMATKTKPVLTKTVKLNRPTECVCVRAVVKKNPTNQKHSSNQALHPSRW